MQLTACKNNKISIRTAYIIDNEGSFEVNQNQLFSCPPLMYKFKKVKIDYRDRMLGEEVAYFTLMLVSQILMNDSHSENSYLDFIH